MWNQNWRSYLVRKEMQLYEVDYSSNTSPSSEGRSHQTATRAMIKSTYFLELRINTINNHYSTSFHNSIKRRCLFDGRLRLRGFLFCKKCLGVSFMDRVTENAVNSRIYFAIIEIKVHKAIAFLPCTPSQKKIIKRGSFCLLLSKDIQI